MENGIFDNQIASQFIGGRLEVRQLRDQKQITLYFGETTDIFVKENFLNIHLAWIVETDEGFLNPKGVLNGFYLTYKLNLINYTAFGVGETITSVKYIIKPKVVGNIFHFHLPSGREFRFP